MGANIKPFTANPLLSAEQALERFFCDIADERLKAELYQWFFFGLNGKGRSLQDLPPEQLSLFADKLQDLVIALYAYHNDRQKGGDHEHPTI